MIFTIFLVVNNMIPIAVFVFYEIMQYSYLDSVFNADVELWDEEKLSKCRMNNMGILEDLGMVDYLFCDKTGTLTKNQLKFKEIKLIESQAGDNVSVDSF